MYILSYIPVSLEFWPVNHTLIYENSESNVYENTKLFGLNV